MQDDVRPRKQKAEHLLYAEWTRGSDAGRDTPVSWAARRGEEEAWKQSTQVPWGTDSWRAWHRVRGEKDGEEFAWQSNRGGVF